MSCVEYELATLLCDDPRPVRGGSVSAVFHTTYEDRPAILKLPRVDRPQWSGDHVWRDARVLVELEGIPTLPRQYKVWDLAREDSVASLTALLYGDAPAAFGLLREYIEGDSLGDVLRQGRSFDQDRLIADVAAIHECGYAALDITLNNILIDPQGVAHLMDFGLSVRHSEVSANEFSGLKRFDRRCLRELLPGAATKGYFA